MWQVEDLLRANGLSLENMRKSVIDTYNLSDEQRSDLEEWYNNLIEMMYMENVTGSGHLQINKNVLIMLTDLHARLLKSPKVPFYTAAYYKVLPYIVEFRNKSNGQGKTEIENCFDALYMVWLMRLQKREMNTETLNATAEISKFVSMLSLYYKEDEEGRLDLDNIEA